MTYELAKQLKEAGFPQGGEGKTVSKLKNIKTDLGGLKVKAQTHYTQPKYAYIPTLSELIEACGGDSITIRLQSYWSENDLMWQADTSGNFMVDAENHIAEVGSTPEEAVAKLWLELKKKHD